jgi:membrane fusion protein, multidrug efflux system
MNRKHLKRGVLNILATVFVISGCSEDVAPVVETILRVKYFEVGEQATGQARRISGKLMAADTSPLSFGVGGTVEQVLVTQDDSVAEGQLLASLDDESLRLAVEQARAQLNISRAKVSETKQVYDRTLGLFEKRASSQAEVDTATSNHKTAISDYLKSLKSGDEYTIQILRNGFKLGLKTKK